VVSGPITAILSAAIVLGVGVALAESGPVSAFSGTARAVDGDTLDVSGRRTRLAYIDAPESRQTCLDSQRRSYACGEASTRALRYMLAHDPRVTCHVKDIDRHGRAVAVCRNSGGDLGARLVATGMAIRYARYAGESYRDEEAAAKAERLGLWAGSFEQPETWRRENRR
jgi:endonuclease YncB( thermonuclease family)